jgi:PAS domain S-box-containing protein
MQSEPIKARESVKGKIEVGYLEERPEEDEGPFLKEERMLINTIAERLGHITERRKVEQELKDSRERFIELAQLLPALIYEIDLAGNFFFLSDFAYKLFGYSQEDAVKMQLNALALLTPESKELASKDMMGLLEGIDRGPVVYYAVKKDGTVFPIELYAALILQEGKPVGFRGIIIDITERKKDETALSRYSDLLKIINRILRHDIINHLSVIISALKLYGKSKEDELLKEASHRANESVELIRKMKDLELLVALRKELKPIDVRGIIEKIKEQYESIAYNIKGDGNVMADEALDSVIVNIITNAIIHGKTERIDVSIEEKGEWCEIRIADYGIGIPDEIKGGIFEEGFRYGKTGQSGLGLYIVKMVMERYEGSVHVEDNIPNGAVFVLRLRRVPA